MTAYNNLADSKISVDAPITQEVLTAIRDNPIAITEGSSGAPKIQHGAISVSGVTAGNFSAFEPYEYIGTGDAKVASLRFRNDINLTSGNSQTSSVLMVIGLTGVYRFRLAMHKRVGFGGDRALLLIDDAVVLQRESGGNSGIFDITADIAVSQGQEIKLRVQEISGGITGSSVFCTEAQCFIGVSEKSAAARGRTCTEDITELNFSTQQFEN
jgi:hypothetical protein